MYAKGRNEKIVADLKLGYSQDSRSGKEKIK